ncbi:glycosyltransferase [Amycolatopsis pigmentata]|uniref:Glycosyltransferase n=1 Tax=Amycolatopsis pigmentata TaxID=450801 RepID=A0ABW5FQP5_9PSEU
MIRPLRVVLVLKTAQGGLFTLSHVDELRARGHEVVAVLPPPEGPLSRALAARGVAVVDSPFDFSFRSPRRAAAGLLRLRRTLRELAPDVLHYHLYASALATRLASLRFGAPRVHMVAGPLYLESALIRMFERRLARLDTVTIAASEFTARYYRAFGRTREQTPVIFYGADLGYFRPASGEERARARESLGIAPDTFVAVMVALVYAPKRLVHRGRGIKGHDVVLDAWRGFHAEYPDSHLILVGGGFGPAGERHRLELMDRFRTANPGSGVTWLDTVDDVRPYYAAADVSVSPSLSENHGAAREACAMGVPSIVSDAGALPDTVVPGSGWVVRRGNAAELAAALRLARAEHLRGELVERGARARRLAVELFDDARIAAAVADVIESSAEHATAAAEARPRVFSIFTEARFARRPDGGWTALDPATRAQSWDRYLHPGSGGRDVSYGPSVPDRRPDEKRVRPRAAASGGQPTRWTATVAASGPANPPSSTNQVRVVGRGDPRALADTVALPGGVTLVPLPYYVGVGGLMRRLVPLVVAVARAVATADTIILRVPGVMGSIAAAVCRVLRREYAVEVIGDPADVLRAGVLGSVGRRLAPLAEAQMRWLVRHAGASLYVTNRTLQRRYPRRPGTPSIGLSNVLLRPGTLAAQSRAWRPAPFRVVTIGSQENHYKGHDVLLRAVRELVDSGLDLSATIIGGGRVHGELIELAHAMGLAERVRFTGVVDDRAAIRRLLDSASLFALPSRTEGMPRALIEAMARALPAVGSRIGGIPELLSPSCLVPVDDHRALAAAMARLLTDQQAWEEQSRDNLKLAQTFEQSLLEGKFSAWLAQVPAARRR